jgi:ABC-type xylose transport system substrate-binding protein
MGKRMNDDEKFLVGALVGLGALLLYYLTAGTDRENNAALIPDGLEDRIDRVVDTLNAQVGKNWVNWGTGQLKAYLRNTLPPSIITLVDIVYAVEQAARQGRIAGYTKRPRAIATATAQGLI